VERRVNIRTTNVQHELAELARSPSQRVRHLLKVIFEKIQENPAAYPEIDEVPEDIDSILLELGGVLRKAPLVHQKHDYRLIYLHWKEANRAFVEFQFIFQRRAGYERIDWDLLSKRLGG